MCDARAVAARGVANWLFLSSQACACAYPPHLHPGRSSNSRDPAGSLSAHLRTLVRRRTQGRRRDGRCPMAALRWPRQRAELRRGATANRRSARRICRCANAFKVRARCARAQTDPTACLHATRTAHSASAHLTVCANPRPFLPPALGMRLAATSSRWRRERAYCRLQRRRAPQLYSPRRSCVRRSVAALRSVGHNPACERARQGVLHLCRPATRNGTRRLRHAALAARRVGTADQKRRRRARSTSLHAAGGPMLVRLRLAVGPASVPAPLGRAPANAPLCTAPLKTVASVPCWRPCALAPWPTDVADAL